MKTDIFKVINHAVSIRSSHRRGVLFALAGLLAILSGACSPESERQAQDDHVIVQRISEPWTGDLDEIRSGRRTLRVLVSYDRTNFFIDKGRLRGLEYELLNEYQKHLNRDVGKRGIRTKIVFVAVPFEQIIPGLLAGRGDIAAAGLTITPERQRLATFTEPYITNVQEIVVASKTVTDLEDIKDLSGRRVHILAGSSHVRHLKELNRQLRRRGRRRVTIVQADENLASEDILEMVNAGIFSLTVTDHHIAELWSNVLRDVVVRNDVVINAGGRIAWAVRKENPKLLASINEFIRNHGQGTLLGNILLNRYYKNVKWIQNPLTPDNERRLQRLIGLFQKYAAQYGFDWVKIAALAYQESGLDQRKKSSAGAVGIMQVRPSTAAGNDVGIPDIGNVEQNIHAGVKYLAVLRDRYFNDPAISPVDRVDFTFAAYNAGPTRINALRQKAEELGLDPNKWFFNVEYVAQREIGRETVRYVANVNKYFIAYKSSLGMLEQKTMEREKLLGTETTGN